MLHDLMTVCIQPKVLDAMPCAKILGYIVMKISLDALQKVMIYRHTQMSHLILSI